jgi:isopenicillin N synthase-like dioxygenase
VLKRGFSGFCTGTDLEAHGELSTCYAGYHYDLNFLTIHGKSRFPGLAIWLQDGRRMPVSIPSGCLLIQAGKQMEWLTNGHIRAGFHEVPLLASSPNANPGEPGCSM